MEQIKKILVTGASGMVGKYVQRELGPNVTYLSSKECNLEDYNQVDRIWQEVQPTHVIHLGAKVGGILENLQIAVLKSYTLLYNLHNSSPLYLDQA